MADEANNNESNGVVQPPNSNQQKEPFNLSKTLGRFFKKIDEMFPNDRNAIICALGGFVIGILLLVLGIHRVLVVALFTVIGVAIGQYIDGNPKIINKIKQWFSDTGI